MRFVLKVSVCISCFIAVCASSYAQVIKEIDYSYEKVANIPVKSARKNVFQYGSDKNKLQVFDLKKDSGVAAFDTLTKYTIVYDSLKNEVIQISFGKRSPGGWKKQAEIITLYNKDKSIADIQWKVTRKDKIVPYRKFSYSYDSLKKPIQIVCDMADSTGNYKPDSKIVYEYSRKGVKDCSFFNYGEDKKWTKISMYSVSFDSLDMVVALMKFRNGNRLDNRYSIENSYNASTSTRTIKFKDYHPETKEYAGKPLNASYLAANYLNDKIALLTGFTAGQKGDWIKEVTVRYVYGDAGHPLNNVLKSYMNYNPLIARFNDYTGENYVADVNSIIDGSRLFESRLNKCLMVNMEGPLLQYLVE